MNIELNNFKGVFCMNKELKNIIEKTINLRGAEERINNYKNMSKKGKEELKEVENKEQLIMKKIEESLTEEQNKLFLEYEGIVIEAEVLRENYMFRAGVMSGFTDLNYINKELGEQIDLLNYRSDL
jgi:hypothetical protein